MKILCVFGKYQYGQKSRGLSTEYFSFIPAFESLGHEIIFFDSWDRSLYKNFIELNSALINTVKEEHPDIIFSVQLGYEIWLETWDYIMKTSTCKTINWCTDDSWKYKEHSKFLAPHFDLMVTTYEEFLPFYNSQKANVFLSTWAVPVQWIRTPKISSECKYNVTFVGAAHGDRKEKIEKLKKLGIDVKCFGYGWENGAIDAEDIPKIFNDSKISLNFANSNGENQIKARVFEVTGSGGFLMTEDAKNLDKVFKNDEIVIFENIEECAKKIKYFLAQNYERDLLVKNSFDKTSKNYSYKNRLEEILSYAQTLHQSKPVHVEFESAIIQHTSNIFLNILKNILLFIGTIFYGREKGKRFARRLAYEFSWRVFKENTYRSKSIVGRMFYSE